MRKAFQMFDTTKCGFIDTVKISTILNTLGQQFDEGELQALIDEEDPEETGRVNFDQFANIASNFLVEDEDAEAMQQELKEAFRLYDREGNGYITTRFVFVYDACAEILLVNTSGFIQGFISIPNETILSRTFWLLISRRFRLKNSLHNSEYSRKT